jgi:purine catabolism regulator
LTLEIGQRTVEVYASIIRMSYGRRCCLLLIAYEQSLSEADLLTIERANPIVLLELMNIEARHSVEHKYKDQFIRDWLYGRFENVAELRVRAQVCGYPIGQHARFAVAILKTRNPANVTRTLRAQGNVIDDVTIYPIQVEQEVVMLVQMISGSELRTAPSTTSVTSLNAVKKWLPTILAEVMDDVIAIYLGKDVSTEHLHDSYSEAKRVLQIGSECNIHLPILTYDDLGIYPILSVLPESSEVSQFKKKYLQPLLDFEKNHQLNIIETLDTYFHCNQNMRLTAEKLFAHYNTIVYRMEKVRTLLGFDLDVSDTRLHLHLALKLHHLEESKKRRIHD